jgi:hypothetical protein
MDGDGRWKAGHGSRSPVADEGGGKTAGRWNVGGVVVERLPGVPAHPRDRSAQLAVTPSLLATETGGGARASPAAVVCSGRRDQRKGASRAAVNGGGAVALDGGRKGTEELVGWRPWSSARGGNGDSGRVRARGSHAKPRKR